VVAKRPVSVRRRRAAGGNSLIETVFTLLPTFALICAFLDFGMVLFRWTTLQNAVREGCRYAITFQTNSGSCQDASIESVVQQYAMNMVTSSDNPQHIFVNYYAPGSTTPIVSGGNVPGNIVQVSVQNVSWAWMMPFSGSIDLGKPSNLMRSSPPVTLNVYAADVLGGYPTGTDSVCR
jgi:Flp pilus assembly protein TadG